MNSSKPVVLAEWRRQQSMALRLSGLTYHEIGDKLHISHTTASRAVRKTLKRLNEESRELAQELVALESMRLDALQAACWEQAMAGDLPAVGVVLKIMERRARLLGLDRKPDDMQQDMLPTINVYTKGNDGNPDRLTWTNKD